MRRLLLIALILAPVCAGARTFGEIVSEVLGNNLSARAENARAAAQHAEVLGDNSLEAPEVEFGRLWGTQADFGNKWTLSVSQSFDWPGVYAARREAARNCGLAYQLLAESNLMDLRQQVRLQLVDIIHTNRLIELQTRLVEAMDSMETYYRRAAEAGAETRLDYNKTALERIAVHRELHTLEAQLAEQTAQLQALNGGKPVSSLVAALGTEYPAWPAAEVLTDVETVRSRDPEYAAAVASAEASRSMAKVEKRLRLPGFSVGYEHEVEGAEVYNGFTVGLTLPVWGKRHKARAASLEAQAAEYDAERILGTKLAELESDRRQVEALATIIEEYEPVINDQNNPELLRRALHGGQINFLTFIQESNFFIQAKRDYYDTIYLYNRALVSLARYM